MDSHPSQHVQQKIIELCDALCSWERATSIPSVLIIRERGFCYRAESGKPGVPDDLPDAMLLGMVAPPEPQEEPCATCGPDRFEIACAAAGCAEKFHQPYSDDIFCPNCRDDCNHDPDEDDPSTCFLCNWPLDTKSEEYRERNDFARQHGWCWHCAAYRTQSDRNDALCPEHQRLDCAGEEAP